MTADRAAHTDDKPAHADDKPAHSPFGNSENANRAALVEKVAMAIAKAEIEYFGPHSTLIQCQSWALHPDCYRQAATAAIDLIRAETLEEAARVVELIMTANGSSKEYTHEIAAAIRALKEKASEAG